MECLSFIGRQMIHPRIPLTVISGQDEGGQHLDDRTSRLLLLTKPEAVGEIPGEVAALPMNSPYNQKNYRNGRAFRLIIVPRIKICTKQR